MTPEDFARLAPALEPVSLPSGALIAQPDQLIDFIYFIETGIASAVAISPDGQEVEAGIVGRDGFTPIAPLMGADRTLHRISIQVPDDAFRIDRESFEEAVVQSASLRALLMRYVYTLTTQTSYTALSNAVHPIDERLARWLLMCDDRNDGRDLALTHEFISIMLAVRRPSVTTALHVLEGNGFIRSERNCIIIRNRGGLERFAGDAYGKPEAEYRRLLGSMR